MSLLYILIINSFILGASAAPSPSKQASASSSTSPDDIPQQQHSEPSTPITILTLKNVTLTPTITTANGPTIIPIPGTGISLRISYIGEVGIAPSLLSKLFSSADESIADSVFFYPYDRVTPLPWFHQSYDEQSRSTVAIRVRGNGDKVPTWLQLFWVLVALKGYMKREPHPVNFDVRVVDQGVVAAGVLWCSQRQGSFWDAQRERRGAD